MKDSYRQHSTRRKRIFSPTTTILLFIIFVVTLIHIVAPDVTVGTARTLVHPLWSNESKFRTSVGEFFSSLRDKQELVRENRELQREIDEVEVVLLQNQVLEEENAALKELLGRKGFEELVLAPVLRRPPSVPYDLLLVDIGDSKEVRPGNRVVAGGTVAIGTISRIDGKTATVTLFSTPGVETEVFIGTSTASVVARGAGSGNFIVRLPRELDVAVGDNVVLPGLSPFVFASVVSVEAESADPFEVVRFQNPINVNSLRWVEIVTDNQEIPRIVEPPRLPEEGIISTTSEETL